MAIKRKCFHLSREIDTKEIVIVPSDEYLTKEKSNILLGHQEKFITLLVELGVSTKKTSLRRCCLH